MPSFLNSQKNDFEGWAHGLERTGYATDPEYGEKLVSLVQRFDLADYDKVD